MGVWEEALCSLKKKKQTINHHKNTRKPLNTKQDQHYHIQKTQHELQTWFLLSVQKNLKGLYFL